MRSMILVVLAAAGSMVLGSAGSANAQFAYEWSPQKTRVHLSGKLVFVPADAHGAYFECKVALDFDTGNARDGADKPPMIRSATIKGRGCESVQLLGLPWYVGALDTQDGSFSKFAWQTTYESCVDANGAPFKVQGDGTWLFDGYNNGCLTGELKPNQPLTIIPVP